MHTRRPPWRCLLVASYQLQQHAPRTRATGRVTVRTTVRDTSTVPRAARRTRPHRLRQRVVLQTSVRSQFSAQATVVVAAAAGAPWFRTLGASSPPNATPQTPTTKAIRAERIETSSLLCAVFAARVNHPHRHSTVRRTFGRVRTPEFVGVRFCRPRGAT